MGVKVSKCFLFPHGHCSGKSRMFDVIQETLENDFPAWFGKVFSYVSNPGLVLPFLLLMILAIYYLHSISKTYKQSNLDLKKKLQTQNEENKKKNKRAALKAATDLEEARNTASQEQQSQSNNNASNRGNRRLNDSNGVTNQREDGYTTKDHCRPSYPHRYTDRPPVSRGPGMPGYLPGLPHRPAS